MKMAAPEEIDNQSNTRPINLKYKFEAGEKVLCYHGPLIYESKCQQVRICEEDNTPEYLIHYLGWNKNWDEWVEESRILKYNDVNVKKQQELERAQSKGKERRKVRRRGTSTETKQSDSKELKSSDSSSQAPGSSNPIKGDISQPIVKEEISQPIVREEISQPIAKPEQNKTDDEPTPVNQIQLEMREGHTDKINDENSCVSNLITNIKQEFDADSDQSCSVNIKVEDECRPIEGGTSTDKDLQRTSCRSSLEPAISSPQLETANITIKIESGISDSEMDCDVKREELASSHAEVEKNPPSGESDVELQKSDDVPAKIMRRRASASEASSSEDGADASPVKRRHSVDSNPSPSEESQETFRATLRQETDDPIDVDATDDDDDDDDSTPSLLDLAMFSAPRRKPFTLPEEMMNYVIDDWHFVNKQRKLCWLPSRFPAKEIFESFISCESCHEDLP
ncbi:AT-rich interactive domain-containing protein 4A-like isoform X2 [Nilaparvata lugens]|uniref:AT-rich interactive domain-containing protein 4A-like isoform X2 n=1 Tax=Nilaparvata lugens TaxID=108931 RepID=UPI00193D3B08|nr:AT-rich interactive domain-containing protein 4A-like isoform X2 [Nilaparvata lugens]